MQFLIIHMHGLGDMLMFVPTFNLLQQKKDYVDLIVFENNSISPIKNSSKIRNIYYCNSNYFRLVLIILKLTKNKYENLLFSNNSSPIKSLILSFFVRAKKKSIITEKKNFPIFKKTLIYINPKTHKVYRNLRLINNYKNNPINFSLNFSRSNNKFLLNKRNFHIGIHPGSNAKNGDKRWDTKKFNKLIEYFEKKNFNIYIFIGSYEKDLFSKFNFKSKKIKIVYDKPFNYVASIIQNLDIFISNETGLAHLSSALKTKTIVILNKVEDFRKTKISIPIQSVTFVKTSRKNFDDLNKIIYISKKLIKAKT